MKITKLRISNFRSIKNAEIDLDDITVFIGANNAGKTAVLDALRIALTRRWGMKGTGFQEYDVHLPAETSDPKTEPPVSVHIETSEVAKDEWPDELIQDLDSVLYLDPLSEKYSINLRVTCKWDELEGKFVPTWEWLNTARQPLTGKAAKQTNLDRFWQYLPVFYLGALRDSESEFTPRSQFWGRLMKAVEIPPKIEKKVLRALGVVNKRLLKSDPMLEEIAKTLGGMTKVASASGSGGADLRLLPLKPWDILAEAKVIARNETATPWLPLGHHGQGLQSLSVLFLFKAFVEHLLAELYEKYSTPVLALEEPEAHLHPQAARALWDHISSMPGQKVLTTHSPYFVQRVPFRALRVVRLEASGTTIRWLRSKFSTTVPANAALDRVVKKYPGKLALDSSSNELAVAGELDEKIYHELLTAYGKHPERANAEGSLKQLRENAALFVSDEDLQSLETYARRIRGEIFFASKWVLLEGQSEYLLFQALCKAKNLNLDASGIAVIDAVNNGNPSVFATLARALGYPWIAVFDGDSAGKGYITGIAKRGFSAAEVKLRCRQLPAVDLEAQLIADGLEPELRKILVDLGDAKAAKATVAELSERLREYKTAYAAVLASRVIADPKVAGKMPQAFHELIKELPALL